ncbi:hypothetical protein EMCRGX_G005806 [Ephydatia muelleri]
MENGPYLGWQKAYYEYLLLVPIYVFLSMAYFVAVVFTVLRLVSWNWPIMTKLKEADRKTITYMLETFFNMLHHREGIRDLNQKRSAAKDCKPPAVSEPQEDTPGTAAETLPTNGEYPEQQVGDDHIELVCRKRRFTGSGHFLGRFHFGTLERCGRSKTEPRERHETIDCIALALDFPKALAEVAGILFLASNGIALLMFLLLLIVDGIESRCYRMVMYVVKATVEYLFVGLMIYASTVRYELRSTEGINLLIQDYLISFALLVGVTTPWLLLLWASVSWFWKRKRAVS